MEGKNGVQRPNKMAIMPIKKLLLTMAIPLMLSLVIQSLYNIVDSIFVARLSEQALTATSLAYPTQILMIALSVGTGVGINALFSRLLGAGKRDQVGKAAATGIVLALLSAAVFMLGGLLGAQKIAHAMTANEEIADLCGQYLQICMVFCCGIFIETAAQRFLQASGRTTLSMVSLVAGAVTNIILDPIMIFGRLGCPALGIRGAAIATVIGQWIGAAVALLLNRLHNPDVPVDFRRFRLEGKTVAAIYKVGLPTIIMQAMGSVMNFGINRMLADATAVAFFGAYYKLQNFLFMPMNGLGQACLPIVGFNYGAQNRNRIRETVRTGPVWG
ncbi:MAG: MATE family efflux transporter, partial [Clostridia bacterium]|nr:MATE family efflux transporter [Clostridia bacterium]